MKITVDESICTLAAAITAANTDGDTGGCVGSGTYGDDTIILGTDIILSVALPRISSTIIIEGGGYFFISGNNDKNIGSVLYIVSTGNLTLNNTTVTNGTGHLNT